MKTRFHLALFDKELSEIVDPGLLNLRIEENFIHNPKRNEDILASFHAISSQIFSWIRREFPSLSDLTRIEGNGMKVSLVISKQLPDEIVDIITQKIQGMWKSNRNFVLFDPLLHSGFPQNWSVQVSPYLAEVVGRKFGPLFAKDGLIVLHIDFPLFEETYRLALNEVGNQLNQFYFRGVSSLSKKKNVAIWNLTHEWGSFYSLRWDLPNFFFDKVQFLNQLETGIARLPISMFLNDTRKHFLAKLLTSDEKYPRFFFSPNLSGTEGKLTLVFKKDRKHSPFESWLVLGNGTEESDVIQETEQDFGYLALQNLIKEISEILSLSLGRVQLFKFSSFEAVENFLKEESPSKFSRDHVSVYEEDCLELPFVVSILREKLEISEKKDFLKIDLPISGKESQQITNETQALISQAKLRLKDLAISDFDYQMTRDESQVRISFRAQIFEFYLQAWNFNPFIYFLGQGIFAQYFATQIENVRLENGFSFCLASDTSTIEKYRTKSLAVSNLYAIHREKEGRDLIVELADRFEFQIRFSTPNQYLIFLSNPNLSVSWVEESRRRIEKNLLPLWNLYLPYLLEDELEETYAILLLCFSKLFGKYPFLELAANQILLLEDTSFSIPVISLECAKDFERVFLENQNQAFELKEISSPISEILFASKKVIYFPYRGRFWKTFFIELEEDIPRILPPKGKYLLPVKNLPLLPPETHFYALQDENFLTISMEVQDKKIPLVTLEIDPDFPTSKFLRLIEKSWKDGILHSLWGANFFFSTKKISTFPVFVRKNFQTLRNRTEESQRILQTILPT